ncbi:MAG TPA: heavy-metal-associated domain-containing protein [Actinocrinis sp.]|nr:heavy-metal-associated domain-containing protein [Actinocrinis sp.]HEV2345857.1 heavy-metal-associated domain-containing protein [Actinocrinis sp.]
MGTQDIKIGTGPAAEKPAAAAPGTGIVSTYAVTGMHCSHCAHSVTEEVSTIDGVTAVDVDVDGGRVTVTSTQQLSIDDMRAAIDEAGYQLVS